MADVTEAPYTPNDTGVPAAKWYKLGDGVLDFAELDANDEPDADGWIRMGNCPTFVVRASKDFLDHFESMSGNRSQDARIPINSSFGFAAALEEQTEKAAEYGLSAEIATPTNAAILGFSEWAMISAAKLGRRYEIKSGATPAVRAWGVAASDVTVKAAAATEVTAAGGRTLTFTASTKKIAASTGSFLDDGYRVGGTLVVADSSNNDGSLTITAVTALEITVSESLTDEGPLSSTTTLNMAAFALAQTTNYSVDEAEATIFLPSTAPGIVEGDTLSVTLAANNLANTVRQLELMERSEVNLAVRFVGINRRDHRKFELRIPKVAITLDGDLNFITDADETVKMAIVGQALRVNTTTALAYLTPLPLGGVT